MLSVVRDLRRRVGRLPEGSPPLTGLRLGYRAAYLTLTALLAEARWWPLDGLPTAGERLIGR